jgi:ABC-type nitrate/sulfonate/bicarbonate transport system ATPase subunit
MLFVTHELNEALYVADRVVGLSRFHSDGHRGATVVYDRPCPIFKPEDPRDFSRLLEQKEELRNAVFDPEYIKHHSEYVSFWDEIAAEAANLKAN